MTQITRGKSANNAFCGHYMKSGTIWTETNLEFAQMLYGGLDGSSLIRGIMQPIKVEKVQNLFHLLQQPNPRLEEDGIQPVMLAPTGVAAIPLMTERLTVFSVSI
ncbi:unnamed protein product [Mucor hiemalis]